MDLAKNVEIHAKLFAQCELEELVALRNTCKAFFASANNLDASVVHRKVLDRAPWFSLHETDTNIDSWYKCALLCTKRSAQALKKGDKKWKLMADLHVAMAADPRTESVAPTDMTNYAACGKALLESSQAIFEGSEYLLPSGKGVVDGTKIKTAGVELELKTLQASPSAYKPRDTKTYGPGASRRALMVCSPSGLVLKSADTEQRVTCIAENDLLLHIRMQNEFDPERDEEGVDWEETDLEWLVHKPSCPSDRNGNLIIDEDKSVPFLPQGSHGKTFLKLLPGSSGALVTKYVDTSYSFTYLGYVEPTKEMRHIVICYLPRMRPSDAYEYFAAHMDYHVFYNGYFYVYFEGRFVQLWVDLGKHRLLEWEARHMLYGHADLPQTWDTQSLTACRAGFPTMGTIVTSKPYHEMNIILRGKKELQMDRYVTMEKRHGQAVIDLLTGKMYNCEYESEKDLVVPLLQNKKIVFGSISDMVFSRLEKRLLQLVQKGQTSSNIASSYAQWASVYIPISSSKPKAPSRQVADSGLYENMQIQSHMKAHSFEYALLSEVAQEVADLGPRPKSCPCGGDHGEEDDEDEDDDDDYEDEDSEWDEDEDYENGYFVKERDAVDFTRADLRKQFEEASDHESDDDVYDDDTEEDFEQLREAFAGMLLNPDDKQSSMRMFAVGLNDGYIKKKPLPRRHGKMFGPYMDGYAYGVEKMTNEVVEDMIRETKEKGGLENMLRSHGYKGKLFK
ncbi:hypothetical protein CJU89_3728 [Yarrowia sp. B02]|nr:hypothetical protein CJU89_3728 [Yarrowia sp. B02]